MHATTSASRRTFFFPHSQPFQAWPEEGDLFAVVERSPSGSASGSRKRIGWDNVLSRVARVSQGLSPCNIGPADLICVMRKAAAGHSCPSLLLLLLVLPALRMVVSPLK